MKLKLKRCAQFSFSLFGELKFTQIKLCNAFRFDSHFRKKMFANRISHLRIGLGVKHNISSKGAHE